MIAPDRLSASRDATADPDAAFRADLRAALARPGDDTLDRLYRSLTGQPARDERQLRRLRIVLTESALAARES